MGIYSPVPLSWMGLRAGSGPAPLPVAGTTGTVPGAIFMLFQMTFAIITPALISGAIAERMKFGAYCLFILLWATFFYDPLAHMVWDGGYIGTGGQIHALDFAGGTVVHISSGVSALVLCIMLGKRKGHGAEEMRPHNVPMVLLGRSVALVRLVRLQRRFAACRRRRFNCRVHQHPHRDGGCRSFVDDRGVDQVQEADGSWFRVGRGGRPGRHHPGLRLCQCHGCSDYRLGSFSDLLLRDPDEGQAEPLRRCLDVFGVHACGGMWGALATGLFANSAVNSAIT